MTTPSTGLRLWGRVEQFDERSRAYGIAEHLAAAGAPTTPTTHDWDTPTPIPLDQADTPHCVPFAGVAHRIAAPVETPGQTNAIAHSLYSRCKAVDGMPGVQGTSLLAIAKVFTTDGIIDSYRWCFSEDELALAVSQVCPVQIGVAWKADMMDPDAQGYLTVSGDDVGGHSVLVTKIDIEADAYDVLCAWGRWGAGGLGKAKVRREDMATLLAAAGDALVMLEHPLPAPPVTPPTPPAPPHHRWHWPFNRRVIDLW